MISNAPADRTIRNGLVKYIQETEEYGSVRDDFGVNLSYRIVMGRAVAMLSGRRRVPPNISAMIMLFVHYFLENQNKSLIFR